MDSPRQQQENTKNIAVLEERVRNIVDLIERSRDDLMEKLDDILEQTKRTNGRVNELERDSFESKGRRALVTILVSMLTAVVTGLIVKHF